MLPDADEQDGEQEQEEDVAVFASGRKVRRFRSECSRFIPLRS